MGIDKKEVGELLFDRFYRFLIFKFLSFLNVGVNDGLMVLKCDYIFCELLCNLSLVFCVINKDRMFCYSYVVVLIVICLLELY